MGYVTVIALVPVGLRLVDRGRLDGITITIFSRTIIASLNVECMTDPQSYTLFK